MIILPRFNMSTNAANDLHEKSQKHMINNNKKSKNDLQKVIRYLVEGMIDEHKKDKD